MALPMDDGSEQRIREIEAEYTEFLDDAHDQGFYCELIEFLISKKKQRLIVNVNDLRKGHPKRAASLLKDSFEEMAAFRRALKSLISAADTDYSKLHPEFFIGLEGSFGSRHVTPRSLTSNHLGNIICLEGIVTKCSLVRPKMVSSVHYCPATKKTMERKYTDMTSLDPFPSSAAYPTKDEDGNILETEFGLSTFKDHQTFSIQEMPENAPAGQLPRSIDIICDDDLVDKCKPGDRVQVIGSYRCLPGKKGGYTTGTFRTILIANHIKQLNKEVNPLYSKEDVAKIKHLSRQKRIDVFDQLAHSVAPSIHGHEYIKKAVLCMLLGGVEKHLPNGTRIRGDINVLLIGDPSVAKSQMLRYVLHTAPRAIATTGRGSSGVGLTAAVTTDQETKERRLEAGAMVLADRGVVCIDEFDKMSDIDRTAIHEVMEQGRVTIAKAGIHAKLNARCSVLAAANPVYGRYDSYKTPMENIGLQDSLLSRFDLLFILLDKNDQDQDTMIADHVLRMHRYRNPGEQEGSVLSMGNTGTMQSTNDLDTTDEQFADVPIYEKYNALLHGASRKKTDRIICVQFMRKYLNIAKKIVPELTREAADFIAEEYSKLRNQENLQGDLARTQPITARNLETMIRLSTAHAKSRLSKKILLEDAEVAVELVQYACFKRVLTKERKRRRGGDSDESESEEAAKEKRVKKKSKSLPGKKKVSHKKPGDEGYDPYDFDSEAEDSQEDEAPATLEAVRRQSQQEMDVADEDESVTQTTKTTVTDERLNHFKAMLYQLFRHEHSQSVTMDSLRTYVESHTKGEAFSDSEITAAIEAMSDENMIMVSNDIIFLI
ncbi:DNA replication licensing factor MCM3-like [Watersipora subatra]|uniref:DNA replication licensing factor MCM3-like n=1 Tax=Watersipora subatra TaxID=2589382 RepID=UPI00355B9234